MCCLQETYFKYKEAEMNYLKEADSIKAGGKKRKCAMQINKRKLIQLYSYQIKLF